MKNEYTILSKNTFDQFPFQTTPKRIIPVIPDLVLDMNFSPKLYLIADLSPKVEGFVLHGVEWLDASVDRSPSQPDENDVKVSEYYRMVYIHQTYRLTDEEKQIGQLNWLDLEKIELDFSRLAEIPLAERLLFKLEEDLGVVMIHNSIMDKLEELVEDVMVRGI